MYVERQQGDRRFVHAAMLVLAILTPVDIRAMDPMAAIDGTLLTPGNQEANGVLVHVLQQGCAKANQRFVELQYPAVFEGESARGAELAVSDGTNQRLEVFIHQKDMGKGLLISNFCLTEPWLARTRLTLIYGGAGTTANMLINDFSAWPVEK